MIVRHRLVFAQLVACASLIVSTSFAAGPHYSNSLQIDGSWTIVNPSGPVLKAEHMAAYDPAGDRMFIFGDIYNTADAGETWSLEFQPSPHWQQIISAQHPSGRSSGSMVYDPIGQRILMFGGYDGNYKNDVWQLSLGASPAWTPLSPQGTPPSPRHWAASAFDSVGNRLIIIGGYQGGPTFGDVWALNLSGTPTWQQLSVQGSVFTATYGHSAVYDSNRDRILVWGGTGLWSLTLRPTPIWSRPSTSGTAPPSSVYGAAVFDPTGDRMLVLGGYSGGPLPVTPRELSLSSTPTWRQWATDGTTPTPRYTFTAIKRPYSIVTFGGRGAQGTEVGILAWNLTTTQITSLSNPAPCGSSIPINVSIMPSEATGNVVIKENGVELASVPIQSGVASLTLTGLSVGIHTLTAVYGGDDTHTGSVSAPLTQTVNEAPTTITTTTHPNPVAYGDLVEFDASVAPASASGIVDFFVGSNPNAFASGSLTSGTATVTYSGLPAGTHAIVARYRGDGCYSSATAAPIDQVVTKLVTSVTVTTSPNPSVEAFAVTLTANLAPSSATGLVLFSDDLGVLGSAPVTGVGSPGTELEFAL